MFGFVAVSMLDFVLSFFGASFGFNGFGAMGLLSSVIGLGLGVLMLILDFDFVERGIAAGLPERESWRAAFGLTVTIVWIYIELLRLLAILRELTDSWRQPDSSTRTPRPNHRPGRLRAPRPRERPRRGLRLARGQQAGGASA